MLPAVKAGYLVYSPLYNALALKKTFQREC